LLLDARVLEESWEAACWFTTIEEVSLLLPVIMIEANSLSGQNVDTEKQMVTRRLLDGICDE
jgi:hypothetical protein